MIDASRPNARYVDVLLQVAAGVKVTGSTLRALPRLRTAKELPSDHEFKPRDVWPLVIESAAALAGEADDAPHYWNAVAMQVCCWRRQGVDLLNDAGGRESLNHLGMAADFAAGLGRAGLLQGSESLAR